MAVVLVDCLSDLHTGAVDMDPEMESNVRSSWNPITLPSPLIFDPDIGLDDLDDMLSLVKNNNWEISTCTRISDILLNVSAIILMRIGKPFWRKLRHIRFTNNVRYNLPKV